MVWIELKFREAFLKLLYLIYYYKIHNGYKQLSDPEISDKM